MGLGRYSFCDFGASGKVFQELFAAIKTLPIERGTNEPKLVGFQGFGNPGVYCCNEIEFFELLLFEGAALGLDLADCFSVCSRRRERRDS